MSPCSPSESGEKPEIIQAPVTALALGLVAGAGCALLGVGSGLLTVPGLVHLLRLRQQRAVGTSLAVALLAATASVSQYRVQDWGTVISLTLGGVLGAMIGARAEALLRARERRRICGTLVILSGVYLVLRPAPPGAGGGLVPGMPTLPMAATGALVGIVSSVLGAGGGLVMVPTLVLGWEISQRVAQGISLAVIIPVSASGALVHLRRGTVVGRLAGWLAAGTGLSALVTASYVQTLPDAALRPLFGVFLFLYGVTMAAGPARFQASRARDR